MVTFFVKKTLSQQFNSHQFAEIEDFFCKNSIIEIKLFKLPNVLDKNIRVSLSIRRIYETKTTNFHYQLN